MAKIFSTVNTESDRERVKQNRSVLPIIFPWGAGYKLWWGLTVLAAAFTIFLETYQIAFSPGGLSSNGGVILEFILGVVFGVDIIINFNLAYYDDRDKIVFARRAIARHYTQRMFIVDLIGVFPFYAVALEITGEMGNANKFTQNLALLRLFKMVRLHRVSLFFSIIQYSRKISFIGLTLTRNCSIVLVWTHVWACIMFFIARESAFDPENTWLGSVSDLSTFEQYISSLYWSVVTFTTVGYGDFSPVNSIEQIAGVVYMLLNVALASWIIGSITLLIVKKDEKTSVYREALQVLHKYSALHNFDKKLTKRLTNQLKLDFDNREIADEQVLHFFPDGVRRKILRRLYMPSLLETRLMKGTRQQFVDAFLSLCSVEIFSPGAELLQRGSISSDLHLLLEGVVVVDNSTDHDKIVKDADDNDGDFATSVVSRTSVGDRSELHSGCASGRGGVKINVGDFINELGFFTEAPQTDTIRTKTVCKLLTMSRSHYRAIATDHPGSSGVVLRNLLSKVGQQIEDLPQSNSVLRVGFSQESDTDNAIAEVQAQHALTEVQDLVKMHINKQKDDHTTHFCFAASRGDTATIEAMCGQGFDPDSSDYDHRNALMVASMIGNTDVVTKLLEYHANPNLTDMHGTSALFEATKNNHEHIAEILLEHGGELSMNESLAASTLCQAVFDGDTLLIKRLLKAKINVNACDYDKRTAAHIAASEGNTAAFKLLAEAGADLSLKDRWGNTIMSEAERAESGQVLKYLNSLGCQ
ncbi:hypothetical protein ACHAXR_008237 [Thalassiosira sp. AJA248-18]